MRFIADMGVSQATVLWLRKSGHDCVHVRDIEMSRAEDRAIMDKARKDNRIVITFDLDFGTILASTDVDKPSVILFRLGDETPTNVNNRLASLLATEAATLDQGAIVLCEQDRARVRLLPMRVRRKSNSSDQ